MMVEQTVYVYMLNENVDVWRPVKAESLGSDLYQLLGPVPDGESWQFEPGVIVRCQEQQLSDGPQIVAVEQVTA